MIILVLTVGFALFFSFACSIMEACLLSASIGGLIERKEAGSKGTGILLDIKQNRIDDAISAILTLNTIAHTIGASLAGAQAAVVFGDKWVGLFSGVLTILILVITEIIPKTLGTVYAVQVSGWLGPIIAGLTKFMKPIVFLMRGITKLVAREKQENITRGEISAIVSLAAHQGTISLTQSKVLRNLLWLDQISVADVMTPRTVVVMRPFDTTLAELLPSDDIKDFSRIPIYGANFDDVHGYVLVRDVWSFLANGGNRTETLERFVRKVRILPKSFTVGAALRLLTENREHLAVILDEFGGISGIITLEDIFETMLGFEIMDELDRVEDMRIRAVELRDKRLERLDQRRIALETEAEDS